MTWSSRSRRGSAWSSHSAIVQNAMRISSRIVHRQASCLTDDRSGVSRVCVGILRTRPRPGGISCRGLRRSRICHQRTLRARTAV